MIPINNCQKCAFFMMNKSCLAFDEIPDIIWTGENPHTSEYTGDKGIIFSDITEKEKINENSKIVSRPRS